MAAAAPREGVQGVRPAGFAGPPGSYGASQPDFNGSQSSAPQPILQQKLSASNLACFAVHTIVRADPLRPAGTPYRGPWEFEIITRMHGTFYLRARSHTDMLTWIRAIKDAAK